MKLFEEAKHIEAQTQAAIKEIIRLIDNPSEELATRISLELSKLEKIQKRNFPNVLNGYHITRPEVFFCGTVGVGASWTEQVPDKTLLHHAVDKTCGVAVDLLIEAGADVSKKTKKSGLTAYQMADARHHPASGELVEGDGSLHTGLYAIVKALKEAQDHQQEAINARNSDCVLM